MFRQDLFNRSVIHILSRIVSFSREEMIILKELEGKRPTREILNYFVYVIYTCSFLSPEASYRDKRFTFVQYHGVTEKINKRSNYGTKIYAIYFIFLSFLFNLRKEACKNYIERSRIMVIIICVIILISRRIIS